MTVHETTTGPSRRGLLVGAGAGLAGAAAATVGAGDPARAASPDHGWRPGRASSFIGVRNGSFVKDGRPWRFGGTNCYYLHASSHYMIDSVLNNAAQMKLGVVRAWAFNDDPSRPDVALQTAPYTWPEANYDSLDYTVYKAGQLGLRLVLPLVNNWPDYGGMRQYVSWVLGLPDDSYGEAVNHDRFYTDARIRKAFYAYITQLITRRNRYTGIRYSDDPTIMTWELANEPRNRSDKTGAGVRNWADATSRLIKRIAPRQLVAVGDEGMGLDPSRTSDYPYTGYEGNRAKDLLSLPAIDYGTIHLYPQNWGAVAGADPVGWGAGWISDHVAAAKALGKPAVLEEFGLQIDPAKGVADSAARDAGYRRWLDAAIGSGAGGFQFWILTALTDAGVLYEDYDGYRVVYPSPTAELMTAAASRIATA